MSTSFEESFRDLLKSVLIEVLKEVLPPAIQRQQQPTPERGVNSQMLMRPSEAAKALAISTKTLFNLTKEGRISCVRIGRTVRYDPAVLKEWITHGAHGVASTFQEGDIQRQLMDTPKHEPAEKPKPNPRRVKAKPSENTPSKSKDLAQTAHRNATTKSPNVGVNQTRDVRGFIASRIGANRDELPVLTHGKIREIMGLDIPAVHGWIYHNRDIPEEAIARLEKFFVSNRVTPGAPNQFPNP